MPQEISQPSRLGYYWLELCSLKVYMYVSQQKLGNGRKAGFDLQLDFWQKSTSLVDFQKSSAPALGWMLQRSIAMNGGVQCSNSTMLKSSFPFLHDGTLPVVTYHIPRRLCNLSFEQALVVDPHPLILSTFNTIVPCEKWKKSKSLFHVFVKIIVARICEKHVGHIFGLSRPTPKSSLARICYLPKV